MDTIKTTCCVVGGGPAGMMLGFLLARAGVRVTVLEKHADFLRDFRGDTVHPSTLEMMHQLGLLDEFLKLPHSKVRHVTMQVGDERVTIGNFDTLRTQCHYIALMPQWNFLNFLAEHGRRYETFDLHMLAEATDLIEEGGRIAGVRAKTPHGELTIRADLVVGCDGRHSTVRERGGFKVVDLGAPMDVLWFRLSRRPDDTDEVFGHIEAGRMMVMLNRSDYWQCAYVIPKGGIDRVKSAGLDKFRETVAAISPFVRDRVDEVKSWDDVKLLTVAVDRLERWYREGLLCIGDAAHAMSPIGGVGINLAVQDAVAAANIMARPLRHGSVSLETLEAVQQRRMFATRIIQAVQIVMQNRLIAPALIGGKRPKAPLILKMMQWPLFNRIPARFFGLGVRPERIQTPDIARG